jgi:hypothetical protein
VRGLDTVRVAAGRLRKKLRRPMPGSAAGDP